MKDPCLGLLSRWKHYHPDGEITLRRHPGNALVRRHWVAGASSAASGESGLAVYATTAGEALRDLAIYLSSR